MIPEWLLIPDSIMIWVYIAGVAVYTSGAIAFLAYRVVGGGGGDHFMMSLALFLLAVHHAILAVRNFRYWFSITETVALTRIALALMLVFSMAGFVSHLLVRWKIRNE